MNVRNALIPWPKLRQAMNRNTLKILRCPDCDNELTLTEKQVVDGEIIEGLLTCTWCHREYEITMSVPRLLMNLGSRKRIAEGYGFEWTKMEEGKLERGTLYGQTQERETENFFSRIGIRSKDILGKAVLDAGCGYGRLIQALGDYGAQAYGVDISSSIEIALGRKTSRNVQVIQADILNLPFKAGSFDYVWSNLAICYLTNPKVGFMNLAKLIKPGGRLFICVPDKDDLAFSVRFRDYFRIGHLLPVRLLFYFSWCTAILLYAAKRILRKPNTTLRTNAFFVFTAIHPNILTRHSREEVIKWFSDNYFSDVVCLREAHTLNVRGIKTQSEPGRQTI